MQRALNTAFVAGAIDLTIMGTGGELAMEDAVAAGISGYIGETLIEPHLIDSIPGPLQHVSGALCAGAVYVGIQRIRPTCPIGGVPGQFFYGVMLPIVSDAFLAGWGSHSDNQMDS